MNKKRTYFGEQVARLMMERGLSFKDLGDMLQMNRTTLFYMLQRQPKIQEIQKVAAVLEMPLEYFIEDKSYIWMKGSTWRRLKRVPQNSSEQ